jgi:hypothetical protein
LDDYIVTQWEGPSDSIIEKMDEIKAVLQTIKETSDSASSDIRTAALVSGIQVQPVQTVFQIHTLPDLL